MGYFANSDEGDAYEARYCRHCVHEKRNGTGCPIMLAHLLWAYGATPEQKEILDTLIPRDGIENRRCTMFVDLETVTRARKVRAATQPGLFDATKENG